MSNPIFCSYCGKEITTSVVMKDGKFWHATQNSKGEYSFFSCWEQSVYGKYTLVYEGET